MKKQVQYEQEQAFLNEICTRVEGEVLSLRLRYLFYWYTEKAQANRAHYHIFRSLTTALPALIALLSLYSFAVGERAASVAAATISILITLINNRMDHYRYYESWLRYRSVAEALKRETVLFLNRYGPYATADEPERRQLFAGMVEQIADEELINWEHLKAQSQTAHPTDQMSPVK